MNDPYGKLIETELGNSSRQKAVIENAENLIVA
jgi:hypothetical protein